MSKKVLEIIILSTGIMVLAHSAYFDFRNAKINSSDLRNRVVGSRLINDGISPYFYKWKSTDPIRYYDPENFDHLKVSNMTATPFFHQLIHPLAEMPQWKISRWWCAIQYLLFFAMVGMALILSYTNRQKGMVLIFSILFLLTDAWKMNVSNGQCYLFFPFLAMLIYFILQKGRSMIWAPVAGLLSIVLVLTRPNALIFFIPFVFLLKNYGRRWLLSFFVPILLLAGWTLGDRGERFFWQDYVKSLGEQIKFHQQLDPVTQENERDPELSEWEGIFKDNYVYYHMMSSPIKLYPENGNFFYLVNIIFHRKIPVKVFLTTLLVIIMLLTGIYYFLNRYHSLNLESGSYDLARTALFGFGLFMISDLFSPIFRTQYYTVQVFFPLLLAASIYQPSFKLVYRLLLGGILLNISHIPFIKMEHTIGEYLIIGVIILFSLTRGQKMTKETRIYEQITRE